MMGQKIPQKTESPVINSYVTTKDGKQQIVRQNHFATTRIFDLADGFFLVNAIPHVFLFRHHQNETKFCGNVDDLKGLVDQVIKVKKHYFAIYLRYDQRGEAADKPSYQVKFGHMQENKLRIHLEAFNVAMPEQYRQFQMKGEPLWYDGQLKIIEFKQKNMIGVIQQRSVRPIQQGPNDIRVNIYDIGNDKFALIKQITMPENIRNIQKLDGAYNYMILGWQAIYYVRIKLHMKHKYFSSYVQNVKLKIIRKVDKIPHNDQWIKQFKVIEKIRWFNSSTKQMPHNPFQQFNTNWLCFKPLGKLDVAIEQDFGRGMMNHYFPPDFHRKRNPIVIILYNKAYLVYNLAHKQRIPTKQIGALKYYWYDSINMQVKNYARSLVDKNSIQEEQKTNEMQKNQQPPEEWDENLTAIQQIYIDHQDGTINIEETIIHI